MEEALSLRDRLNLETARIGWHELERYFAGGKVIHVDATLDLVEVATTIAEDNTHRLQQWLHAKQVAQLRDETAIGWANHHPDNLWAVVVAPWVLVQERLSP
ncbi:MAG: DUF2288 domain-containing protein [Candidatus Thiothrix putei]|uniref:DUF2288 domain-containing protein n=1 Tax=Candidatus Thiothrix putei TaxID=3080811 RepID=A0AA95HEA1_9GAMM|nr:MAG: DUF2288 domain-containing protein [Candidatus Thiothrix putei]